MFGNVVEDKVSADITSNYITNRDVDWYQGLIKKVKKAHSKTDTSSKHDSRLVAEDPSGTQVAKLEYFHGKTVCSKGWQDRVTADLSLDTSLDPLLYPRTLYPSSCHDSPRPAPSEIGVDSQGILDLS